jgi:hypothetical protein
VWLGECGGVESCWRLYTGGVLHSYLTRFRAYTIARPPQEKNLGEEGASDR